MCNNNNIDVVMTSCAYYVLKIVSTFLVMLTQHVLNIGTKVGKVMYLLWVIALLSCRQLLLQLQCPFEAIFRTSLIKRFYKRSFGCKFWLDTWMLVSCIFSSHFLPVTVQHRCINYTALQWQWFFYGLVKKLLMSPANMCIPWWMLPEYYAAALCKFIV